MTTRLDPEDDVAQRCHHRDATAVEEVTIRPGLQGCFVEFKILHGTHARWLVWREDGVEYEIVTEPLVFTLEQLISVANAEMVSLEPRR